MTLSRLLATASLALLLSGTAIAHDFWIAPERWQVAAGEPLAVRLMVGHGAEQSPWRLSWDRLASLRSIGPQGLVDQQAGVVTAGPGVAGGATIRLEGDGTHMVLTETYHALSDLPAERFNSYVGDEGLEAIKAHRLRTGTGATRGVELYSRRGKALVQVGGRPSDTVLAAVGHTLEIVPEANPLTLRPGDPLPVRVLFRGRPLAGALIDLGSLERGKDAIESHRTDAAGRARFAMPPAGAWKLNVIWGWPIEGRKDAAYESIFSSLTFAVSPPSAPAPAG